MHATFKGAGTILRAYAGCPWTVRLFVFIRYLVCPWKKIIDRLAPLVKEGDLLDIGCGHGVLLHLLLHGGKVQSCVGIDHDSAKIAIARSTIAKTAPITVLDSSQEPLPDQRFDCVTLVDVLYAIDPQDWPKIWQLVHQRLKPEGVLLIKETVNQPKWKYGICLLQEILATRILKYTKGKFPFLPSATYYLEVLRQNGFEIMAHTRLDQGYPWPHYLFVARGSKAGSSRENSLPNKMA